MAESVEILFRIRSTGNAELDRIAAATTRAGAAARSSASLYDHLGRAIRAAGNEQVAATAQAGAMGAVVDRLVGGIARYVFTLTGATVGLGLVGRATLGAVREFADMNRSLSAMSGRLGLSVEELYKLDVAARSVGARVESLEGGARFLALALEDSSGQGARAAESLRALGVQVVSAAGGQRDMGRVLRDTLEALSRVESQAERVVLAQRILGRGAADLLPVISHYDELKRTMAELGVSLDEDVRENFARADAELDKLSTAWREFRKNLAAKIAPIIIPVVASLTAQLTGRSGTGGSRTSGATAELAALQAEQGTLDLRALLSGRLAGTRAAADKAIDAELKRGAALSAGFRDRRAATPEGLKRRAEQIRRELDERGASLSAGGMTGTAFSRLESEFRALEAELRGIEERLKVGPSGALKLSDLLFRGESRPRNPSLFRPGEVFRAEPTGSTTEEREREQLRAFGAALLEQAKEREERAKRLAEIELEGKVRLLELTAGPGGEIEAAQRILDIRREAARTDVERRQAEIDFQARVAEIQRRRLEEYREQAGQVFDALTHGGGGLRDFFRGQLKILERQIFVNASAGIFQEAGGTLGRIGEASGLGGLLQGTIFDPVNAQQPIDRNTTATEQNTRAIERLTSIGGGSRSGVPGGIPGLPAGVFQGTGPGGLIFSSRGGFGAGLQSLLGGGLFAGLRGGSLQVAPGVATAGTAARLGNIAGSGAVVGLGALGIIGGIKQGGARGATQAIGSALGVASTIPGPQQPFIEAGALIAGFVSSLFGDGRRKRDQEISETLERNQFREPASIHRTIDVGGGEIDFDKRGRVRVTQVVTVQVNAMDSRSFLDRRNDIAEAVRVALRDGHDLGDTVRAGVGVAA